MIVYNDKNIAFTHMYLMCKEIIKDSDEFIVGVGTLKLNFNRTRNKIKNKNVRMISYNFEQLYEGCKYLKEDGNIMKWFNNADEFWDYDKHNIQFCKTHYNIDVKYKPLVYVDSLKQIENNPNPENDVLFYGLGTGYRKKVANFLTENCPDLKFDFYLPNSLNDYIIDSELNKKIGNAKIVLNLLSVSDLQPQSRIFYNLINSKCVVSEKCKTNIYGDLIREAEMENIPKLLNHLIKTNEYKIIAENASIGFKKLSEEWKKMYW